MLIYHHLTRSRTYASLVRMKIYVHSPTGRVTELTADSAESAESAESLDESLGESLTMKALAESLAESSIIEALGEAFTHVNCLPMLPFFFPQHLSHMLPPQSVITRTNIDFRMPLPAMPTISRFESLLEGALIPDPLEQPLHKMQVPSQLFFPEKTLLSFLPRSSLLALRLVSIITKIWAENGPRSVFSTLFLSFPFEAKDYASNPRNPSHEVSKTCETLVVNIAGSKTALTTAYNIFWGSETLPTFSSVTHLHLNAPPSDSFWPLLEFRMFMQAVNFPRLKRVSVDGLSIEGVKALRWGPLTSYIDLDWGSSVMWQRLTNLDISLTPSMGVADLGVSEGGVHAVMILHSWIRSFGDNKFEKVRFMWLEGQEGPNPFLLEDVAEMYGSGGEIEMPVIKWKGCKEIWLGGVSLGADDIQKMAKKVKGLIRVVIWMSMLGREVKEGERKVMSRDHEWVMLDVVRARQSQMHMKRGNITQDNAVGQIVGEHHDATGPQGIDGEILEDRTKDEMAEKREGEALYVDEEGEALSDVSREVPFYLDMINEI